MNNPQAESDANNITTNIAPPLQPDIPSTPVMASKSPSLLWRRLAATAIDLLILDIFLYIGSAIASLVVGVVLSWLAFFVFWYLLEHKKNITIGKVIVQIHSEHSNENADKSQRLLVRFAMTWVPLLVLSLPAFELNQDSQPLIVTVAQIAVVIWYIILLVQLIATKGHKAFHDRFSGFSVILSCNSLLTAKRKALAWGYILALLLEIGYSLVPSSNTDNPEPNPFPEQGGGFPLETLNLTAHTVYGFWKESDLLFDDESDWSGTAAVISRDKNRLYLVSNSHVLSLGELAHSDDDGDGVPEIRSFGLNVVFASGKKAPVLRFADQVGAIDLSLLEIDATDLSEGKDYFIVPFDEALNVKVGDEAVAVGSPRGLSGTHTFGKISAIREMNDGEPYRALQTDAAINPGNSGGPLFVKRGNIFKWAGINTFTINGGDNLGFAIDAKHVWDSKYAWFSASPQGAADAIKSGYNRNAVVE